MHTEVTISHSFTPETRADLYIFADISGANIAFKAHALTHLSEEAMFEVIGSPKAEELLRLDGKPLGPGLPKQLAKNTGWDDWIDEDEEDIRFIDWGEAFALGAEPARLAQPAGLQAPEIIFNSCFDYRVDLWRTGCTVYFALEPLEVESNVSVDILNDVWGTTIPVSRQYRSTRCADD